MWNPERIEIVNLFAHKESVYDFKNNVCTVIFGRNETDRNLENNGAGKTSLLEAISIALTNESLRSIKKDSFINRNEEDCKVVFHLFNPVLKMKLKISRKFFRSNKPVKVEIWENDILNTQITSVNEANKRVLELIGISRDDLMKYFIISQDNRYTFFTAPDAEKKEVMNRITSADMINPVIDELKERLKEKSGEYERIEAEIDKLADRKELLEEQVVEFLENDNTAEEIKDLEELIAECVETRKENESRVKDYQCQIDELKVEISEIEIEDIADLKEKRRELKLNIEKVDKDIYENQKIQRKLKAELSDITTCPNCEHEFIHESELDLEVEQAEKLLNDVVKLIKTGEDEVRGYKDDLKLVVAEIKETEELEDDLSSLQKKLDRYERNISIPLEDIKAMCRKITRHEKEITELKNRKKDDKVLKGLKKRIKECDVETKACKADILPVEKEIEVIKFWQFNMGKNGFSTYLANKSVKVIEGITNSYLRKFGVDLSVLMNGFTVLKSGEVREKIDIFALNDGVTPENFLAKSGGERGRITLAGILGIQHLINLSTNGRGLNLLLLDEVLTGIDAKGQESVIKILNKVGITVMMITQNIDENLNIDNKLTVVKTNDVSTFQ